MTIRIAAGSNPTSGPWIGPVADRHAMALDSRGVTSYHMDIVSHDVGGGSELDDARDPKTDQA